jgi:hypothetical protein
MALPDDETTTEQPSIDFEALGLEPVSDEELFGFGLQAEEAPKAETPEIDYEALGLEPVGDKELFGFEMPKEEQELEESFLRPVADPFLNIGAGINDVVKGFTDAFGADNAVSQNLAKNSEWYRSLLSAGAKQDQEEIGRIMQEAEGQGMLAEVGAGLKALSVAPVDLVSQGIGSLIPFIATAGVGKAVGLSKAGIAILQGVQGGAVGGGIVKGEIYSAVKEQLINSGVDEAKAEKAAQEAQAYNGKNLDQILLGVGLGVAASTTGADSAIRALISRKVGKEAAEQVSEQAIQEVLRTGFVRGAVKDGAVEFATEALQGGQERLAANVAVGREGFDVEPMRGVFGQATLEGALGGILGGGAGGISAKVEQLGMRESVALRDAAKAAQEAKQNNAPASAAAVEEQITQTLEEAPEQRVARLQEEATAAAGIELEEEVPVSGLPPVATLDFELEGIQQSKDDPDRTVIETESGSGIALQTKNTPRSSWAPENAIWIVGLASKKRGDGTSLVRQAAELAVAENRPLAFEQSPAAQDFYTKLGFKPDNFGNFVIPVSDLRTFLAKPVAPTPEGAVAPVEPVVEPVVAEPQPVAEVAPERWDEEYVSSVEEGNTERAKQLVDGAFVAASIPETTDSVFERHKDYKMMGLTFEEIAQNPEALREQDQDDYNTVMYWVSQIQQGNTPTVVADDNGILWDGYHRLLASKIANAESLNVFKSTKEQTTDEATKAVVRDKDGNIIPLSQRFPQAAPAVTPPAEVAPTPEAITPTPETPNLEPLRRVARAEQTEEDVSGLVGQGLVELYNGQPVITQAGLETLPETERPRLNPEARKIQIDTGSNEVVAEAISKNLRIGVDQVGANVRMPAGWVLDGDIYVPPAAPEVAARPKVTPEERIAKLDRLKQIKAEIDTIQFKPVAGAEVGLSGLTTKEAKKYSALMMEAEGIRFDLRKELDVAKIPSEKERDSAVPAPIVKIASDELVADRGVFDAIAEAAAGTFFGQDTAVDKVMNGENPNITPNQFYDTFNKTREALRERFGDTIKLYRAVGKQKEKATQNWHSTKKGASQYGKKVVEKDVPIDDIVALNVGSTGRYEEFIVGKKPAPAPEVRESRREPAPEDRVTIQFKGRPDPELGQRVSIKDREGRDIGNIFFKQRAYLSGSGYPLVNEFHIGFKRKYQRMGYFADAVKSLLRESPNPVFIVSSRVVNDNVFKAIDNLDRSVFDVKELDRGFLISLKPEAAQQEREARIQMPRPAGMETEAVTTKLESLGFGRGGIVSVVNEPNASFEGRTIIRDGKVVAIELNAAALKDDTAVERVLNHEIAESANADGALNT